MGTSIAVRKPLLVLGLLFFFSLGRFPAPAQDQKPMDSGIELIGRSDKEPPPQVWHVEDATTNKKVASVDSRWGFTPLPPGQYRVSLLPVGWHTLEISWGEVTVAAGKTARLNIDAGIELAGRSKEDQPLSQWEVFDLKTQKPVAHVEERWGFTPLPPGQYRVSLLPVGYHALEIPWGEVTVDAGKTARVNIDSGIELVGRSKADSPLSQWEVLDLKTQKPVAHVHERWGFTPLQPGEYAVSGRPGAFPWAEVKVAQGQVVAVRIPDVPERLARVTRVGRKTEKERDPANYKKLEEEIEKAIRRGAAWLKKQDMFGKSPLDFRDVYPTIGILALLHAGEFERDPVLADRCLDYLLRRPLNISAGTYANALTAMALRDWDPARYRQRVLECAQWLVENQGWDKARPMWGYGDAVAGIGDEKKAGEEPAEGLPLEVVRRGLVTKPETYWDNSNSQFAVLGLHSAVHSGIKIPREVWERVEKHFHEKQVADVGTSGGWSYQNFGVNGSMTCAGLASLVVARHHLGMDKSAPDPAVVKGLEWLAGHFTVEENPGYNSVSAPHDQYYYLYGLERVGVLAGTEFLGDHEWYPAGARYLLAHQAADGSWLSTKSPPTADDEGRKRYLDTCYAILFLRRATLSLTGMVPPRPAPMVEKPKPSTLAVRYQGRGLPPVLLPAMELVLDCSGSMKDLVEGEPKYLVARRIMLQAVDELPEDFQVGLRVFGHMGFWGNNPGQPADDDPRWNTDSELKISIGSLVDAKNHRKLIKDWINYVKPAGATPLVYSLLQAKADLSGGWPGPKMVNVVTDGMETCGGKLEDVAAAYKNGEMELVVNIVGFGVPAAEEKQLKEIARQAGGKYYDVHTARQLAGALQEAVKTAYMVLEEKNNVEVTRGQVNGNPLSIKPGRHLVRLMGTKSPPVAIEVQAGQKLELTLDSEGQLQSPQK